MIIRSQDKRSIASMTVLDGIGITRNNGICAYDSTSTDNWILGQYSSVEKAIKVLDMIQRKYMEHLCDKGGSLATIDVYVPAFAFVPPKVFEMPADEDVEV